MAALIGLADDQLDGVLQSAGAGGEIVAANYNQSRSGRGFGRA